MNQNQRENADWIRLLKNASAQQAGDAQKANAVEELRQLLLRAALHTFSRSLSDLSHRSPDDILALAEDCAQDALIAVMQQLPTFRGESRFTTWVYKFGVHKALETARRERWKGQSMDALLEDKEPCSWVSAEKLPPVEGSDTTEQAEIWRIIQQVICEELSERQRLVVKLMIFEEVPMDVVTERFNTNRNAVYKMLHDARKRIRRGLEANGYAVDEILALFSTPIFRDGDDLLRGDCL